MQLHFPASSNLTFTFLLWTGAWTTIDYDLRNTRWVREHGQRLPWYSRSSILVGIFMGVVGLLLLANSTFSLPSPFQLDTQLMLLIILCLLLLFAGIYSLIAWVRYGSTKAWSEAENIGTGPVETNPIISREHFLLIWCLFWLLVNTKDTFLASITNFPSKLLSPNFWVSAASLPVVAFVAYRLYHRRRMLKRLDRRRFALAAEWTPDPDHRSSTGMPYSFVPMISLRLKWSTIALWLAIALASVVFSVILSSPPGLDDETRWFLTALIFAIPLVLLLIVSLRMRKTVEPMVNALKTREGNNILVWYTHTEKIIAWEEARLFACYRLPGLFFGRKNTMVFELSCPNTVVQWTWVLDTRTLCQMWESELPSNEYHQQMQALSYLVSARTGLPLHDLSPE